MKVKMGPAKKLVKLINNATQKEIIDSSASIVAENDRLVQCEEIAQNREVSVARKRSLENSNPIYGPSTSKIQKCTESLVTAFHVMFILVL